MTDTVSGYTVRRHGVVDHRDRHCGRRHGRCRRFHQPRLSGHRHKVGVLAAAALGRRRHRGDLWRIFVTPNLPQCCRGRAASTISCVAFYHPAFGFVAGWLSGDRRLLRRRLRSRPWRSEFTSRRSFRAHSPLLYGFRYHLAWASFVHLCGVKFGGAYHNAWTALPNSPLIVWGCSSPGSPLGHSANRFPSHRARPISATSARRPVRHQPGLRHVLLLRLERGDLYRR